MTNGVGQRGIGSRPGIGRKQIATRFAQQIAPSSTSFPPGAWTFTAPSAGYWKFVLRGAGGIEGSGGLAGASGSYLEITKLLSTAQSVSLVVGIVGVGVNSTTATFPDGSVATAGGAVGGVPGAASGGDVNLAGTAGVALGGTAGNPGLGTSGGAGGATGGGLSGGAGAPANIPLHGSPGGATTTPGPGAGAGESPSGSPPGHGWIEVIWVKP